MGAEAIDDDELQDFKNGVAGCGYAPADFEVTRSARKDQQMGGGQYAVRQIVRIRRASTRVVEEYEAGHGRAWAAAALRDVEVGKFGKP